MQQRCSKRLWTQSRRQLLSLVLLLCTATVLQAAQSTPPATLWQAGQKQTTQGDYAQAKELYLEALEQFQHLKVDEIQSHNLRSRTLMALALLSARQGDQPEAAQYANQAMGALNQGNDPTSMAELLLGMAEVYHLQGAYFTTETYAKMALQQLRARKATGTIYEIQALELLSALYLLWNQSDRARLHLQEAQKNAQEYWPQTLPNLQFSEAEIELQQEREAHVRRLLPELTQTVTQTTDPFLKAQYLMRLGQLDWGLNAEAAAKAAYLQAQEIFQTLKLPFHSARAQAGLGKIWLQDGDLKQAEAAYRKALDLSQPWPRHIYLAEFEAGLGQALQTQHPKEALSHLEKAIEMLSYHAQVNPQAAREYFETMRPVFQTLLQTHLALKDPERALEVFESSKSLHFQQLLRGFERDVFAAAPAVNSRWLQELIPADTLVLILSPTDRNLLHFSVSQQQIQAQSMSLQNTVQNSPLYARYRERFQLENERGELQLNTLIKAYRSLLSNPASELKELQDLGQLLYQLLLQPHEQDFAKYKRLLIIPDGDLALLPFETLPNAQGSYLIETHQVQYIQSLSVLETLQNRNYPPRPRSILALGAPEYQNIEYSGQAVRSRQDLLSVKEQVWNAPKASMRNIFGALYSPHWEALPGAAKELEAIHKSIPDSRIISGAEVNEANLQKMSKSGELKQYRYLHFATHGLTVAHLPELSALVLSQFSSEQEEDNYLRIPEVLALDLNADFVNLSACETGLGKVYQGEGVTGLTQAFLAAGANQVSVSLWQINDQSTALFMSELYREGALFPAQTETKVKRKFIQGQFGETYRHPYYWAPYIVYGRLNS